MITLLLIFHFLSPVFTVSAEDVCSPLNHCQVERTRYNGSKWERVYLKEKSFDKFCNGERPYLQVEDELGIELWVFSGDKASQLPFKTLPYVTVNLYTYKLTHVVATAHAAATATLVNFSYRPKPDKGEFVEVTCIQKNPPATKDDDSKRKSLF